MNPNASPSEITNHLAISSAKLRLHLSAFGRFVLIALGLSIFSLVAAPTASAGVNGKYKYVSASGSINIAGRNIKVSKNDMKAVLANNSGFTVIKKGKIRIDADDADELLEEVLDDLGGKLEISISGPRSLKLRKAGKSYVGSGSEPVVVKFNGKIQGRAVRGNITYKFTPKVTGDKLTMDVPVSGSILGFRIKGTIRVVCKR